MPAEFAYMTSAKNLRPMMDKLRGAGAPPRFTLEFLKSLGFPSSSDRPIIGVLKALGFLTSDGTPTDRYNVYRDSSRSGVVVAEGLREGWADLFLVDQAAHERSPAQLTELFKSVSGKGEAVAKKMATTFKGLSELADWKAPAGAQPDETALTEEIPQSAPQQASTGRSGRVALHHDVHVHLPATSDVAVYTAIFRALKAELLD